MEFTAGKIAELLGGKVEGNAEVSVSSLSKIEEGTQGSVSFLANPQYTQYIYSTRASVVIVSHDFHPEAPVQATLIRVQDPYKAFASLLQAYDDMRKNKTGRETPHYISSTALVADSVYIGAFAYIGDNARIENDAKIYPNAYIGDNVVIGEGTTIHPGVKIYRDCVVGRNCIIHAGTVIGADGFGFAPGGQSFQKVPQIGNVIIEDNVEIGANTAIDRATLGSTRISKGAKLDNLIQIAHNVEIGDNTVVAAQTGIAGSAKVGRNCMIGGQVGIVGHLKVGDEVKIAAQSGIGANVENGETVQGSPAFSISDYRRSYVLFRKLPELDEKLGQLGKELKELKQLSRN